MDLILTAGIVLGLSAGLNPGPLTTLIISQSLQYGMREGFKTALAPVVTDAPIVILSVFVLTRVSNSKTILGLISIVGGLFIVYLAYGNFRAAAVDVDEVQTEPRSLGKGVLANLSSPYPYLFWMSVGAPYMVEAWAKSPLLAAGFLGVFYSCLIGLKMLHAVVAAKARSLFMGKTYSIVMRILGVLLLVFAFLLFRDAMGLLGSSKV